MNFIDVIRENGTGSACGTPCLENLYVPNLSFSTIAMNDNVEKGTSEAVKRANTKEKLIAAREIFQKASWNKFADSRRMMFAVGKEYQNIKAILQMINRDVTKSYDVIDLTASAARKDCIWLSRNHFQYMNKSRFIGDILAQLKTHLQVNLLTDMKKFKSVLTSSKYWLDIEKDRRIREANVTMNTTENGNNDTDIKTHIFYSGDSSFHASVSDWKTILLPSNQTDWGNESSSRQQEWQQYCPLMTTTNMLPNNTGYCHGNSSSTDNTSNCFNNATSAAVQEWQLCPNGRCVYTRNYYDFCSYFLGRDITCEDKDGNMNTSALLLDCRMNYVLIQSCFRYYGISSCPASEYCGRSSCVNSTETCMLDMCGNLTFQNNVELNSTALNETSLNNTHVDCNGTKINGTIVNCNETCAVLNITGTNCSSVCAQLNGTDSECNGICTSLNGTEMNCTDMCTLLHGNETYCNESQPNETETETDEAETKCQELVNVTVEENMFVRLSTEVNVHMEKDPPPPIPLEDLFLTNVTFFSSVQFTVEHVRLFVENFLSEVRGLVSSDEEADIFINGTLLKPLLSSLYVNFDTSTMNGSLENTTLNTLIQILEQHLMPFLNDYVVKVNQTTELIRDGGIINKTTYSDVVIELEKNILTLENVVTVLDDFKIRYIYDHQSFVETLSTKWLFLCEADLTRDYEEHLRRRLQLQDNIDETSELLWKFQWKFQDYERRYLLPNISLTLQDIATKSQLSENADILHEKFKKLESMFLEVILTVKQMKNKIAHVYYWMASQVSTVNLRRYSDSWNEDDIFIFTNPTKALYFSQYGLCSARQNVIWESMEIESKNRLALMYKHHQVLLKALVDGNMYLSDYASGNNINENFFV